MLGAALGDGRAVSRRPRRRARAPSGAAGGDAAATGAAAASPAASAGSRAGTERQVDERRAAARRGSSRPVRWCSTRSSIRSGLVVDAARPARARAGASGAAAAPARARSSAAPAAQPSASANVGRSSRSSAAAAAHRRREPRLELDARAEQQQVALERGQPERLDERLEQGGCSARRRSAPPPSGAALAASAATRSSSAVSARWFSSSQSVTGASPSGCLGRAGELELGCRRRRPGRGRGTCPAVIGVVVERPRWSVGGRARPRAGNVYASVPPWRFRRSETRWRGSTCGSTPTSRPGAFGSSAGSGVTSPACAGGLVICGVSTNGTTFDSPAADGRPPASPSARAARPASRGCRHRSRRGSVAWSSVSVTERGDGQRPRRWTASSRRRPSGSRPRMRISTRREIGSSSPGERDDRLDHGCWNGLDVEVPQLSTGSGDENESSLSISTTVPW